MRTLMNLVIICTKKSNLIDSCSKLAHLNTQTKNYLQLTILVRIVAWIIGPQTYPQLQIIDIMYHLR